MNSPETLRIAFIRQELAKKVSFDPGSAQPYYDASFQPVLQELVERHSNSPTQEKIDFFRMANENIKKSNEHGLSAPVLTTAYIMQNEIKPLDVIASNAIRQGQLKRAIVILDILIGASVAASHLFHGENAIRQGAENEALNLMEKTQDRLPYMNLGDQAQYYLDFKTTTDTASKLMIEDPSGYLLVDEAILRINNESTRFQNNFIYHDEAQKVFNFSGGKLFQSLYEIDYPLAKIACENP